MRLDAFRTKPTHMLSLLLCGLLLTQQVCAQSEIARSPKLSQEELEAGIKRLQENFKRDAEKARKGECTPETTSAGNNIDRFCKMVYDADFVRRAIDTPAPTPSVWERLNELEFRFPDRTAAVILEHLRNKPAPTEEDLKSFVQKTRADMALMEGGTFVMGDYGWLEDPSWPITRSTADDNPFPVKLSDFLIQKRRVTIAEYDTYTRNRGLPLIGTELISKDIDVDGNPSHIQYYPDLERRYPSYNAKVTWQQAHDYCAWLADISTQPFALPSEAQWEYSARSGGKPYAFGIANARADKVDPNALEDQLERIAGQHKGPHYLSNRPSGVFGPNPAGLYDFIGYGDEWVNDWYAHYPTPTPKRPLHNPTGPANGTEKVARASAAGQWTVLNRLGYGKDYVIYDDGSKQQSVTSTAAFRCVINAPRWN
ncbi:formylglycine-generating enzyme family protein [Luteimonas lutimaris]|uniref:Sulfatase-modifying factor enzyme-like domain-containing protein n=1 Tax=Luteimonas lutimaris TaxID=698645 RepID=A0ABP7MRJ7_9GAMM